MDNQTSSHALQGGSAVGKLFRNICNLLYFCGCILTVLLAVSYWSYDIKPAAESKGWGEGKEFVSVGISDKLTNGILCYSYNCDVFYLSAPSADKPTRDVLSPEEGNPIWSDANYAKLQEKTLANYKHQAIAKIALCGFTTIILYFIRRRMKRKAQQA